MIKNENVKKKAIKCLIIIQIWIFMSKWQTMQKSNPNNIILQKLNLLKWLKVWDWEILFW